MTDIQAPPEAAPSALSASPAAPVGAGGKTCAVGAGVLASVCCGNGIVTVLATVAGATGVVGFATHWMGMQGLTLLSVAVAVLIVLAAAALGTRRARAGLPDEQRRQVYLQATGRLAVWALGGYALYFVVVNAVLTVVGFKLAK